MAYNQKRIPKDPQGFPLPSHFNAAADRHDANYGAQNAMRVRIADGDGVALGSRSDAVATGALSGSYSVVSLLKEIASQLRDANS